MMPPQVTRDPAGLPPDPHLTKPKKSDPVAPLPKTLPALTAAVAILALSACASNPPPSGDTYCERARHISATDAQIKVFADNWDVMESYADQIVAANIVYDETCLKERK